MSAPSPSEFLTFYRRLTTHPSLRQYAARPASIRVSRPFSTVYARRTDASVKTDQYPDDKHTTNKSDKLDVQSDSSNKGREAHSKGQGGSATSQADERNSTERAKKDHPEAPDVVIGMQDERGGKGH
ncbi:hypothetical protein B0A49_09969 [Cryomyces minteri]|uniref:Uncharacterized protein n=1 Tax=Cryomyces minteri TaxID=331657 RepID=A0A4U0WDU5_9PEZI|nr:hypothetical protein B0A49_09969 [Cryomyces minteri]